MQEYPKLWAGTEIERSTPGPLFRPKKKEKTTEVTRECEDIAVARAVGVGATKPNTSGDHRSHQRPRRVDADGFGPVLLKSEWASESFKGLIKT